MFLLCVSSASAGGINYDKDGINISLSSEVESAVHNGVELTFVCEFALVNTFLFFAWPDQLKSHRFVLRHHALSNSYLVSEGASSGSHIFRSTTDSMDYVAARAMTLFAEYSESQPAYKMRLRLSKYELPVPMRLSAFITKDWDLNSGWEAWQSAQ